MLNPGLNLTKTMSKKAKRLQKISKRLTTHQLRRLQEKDVALGYDELFGAHTDRGSPYFLGYYSPGGIKYALESYGVFEELRKRGFDELKLSVNTHDPYKQRIAIYYDKKDPRHLIGELVVKRKHITIYTPFPSPVNGRNFEVIAVEWLCMQDPKSGFTAEKPRLPGQKHPGLGMGEMAMEMLIIMCRRLRTAGLLNVPEHFHNSQMYSPQFRYLNPVYAGKREAIVRDLMQQYSLSEISWAIDLGCVTENEQPFEWFIGDQIIPLDRAIKEYFESNEYHQYARHITETHHYVLDETEWRQKKEQIENYITC
jgi:hypothetical protein